MNVSLAEALHILRCRLHDQMSPAERRDTEEAINFICAQDELKEEPAWMRPTESVQPPGAIDQRDGFGMCAAPQSGKDHRDLLRRLRAPMWSVEPVDLQEVARLSAEAIEQLERELAEVTAHLNEFIGGDVIDQGIPTQPAFAPRSATALQWIIDDDAEFSDPLEEGQEHVAWVGDQPTIFLRRGGHIWAYVVPQLVAPNGQAVPHVPHPSREREDDTPASSTVACSCPETTGGPLGVAGPMCMRQSAPPPGCRVQAERLAARASASGTLALIVSEVERARAKHPVWPADDTLFAAAIVSEESGELMRAAVQHKGEGGSLEACDKEAIQTAAVAIRFLERR